MPSSATPEGPILSKDIELGSGFNGLRMCRCGPMLYNQNDLYVGSALRTYGESNQAKLDLLLQLVGRGDVVVDVGAHVGAHTIPLAQAVGATGAVIAIEAQRILCQLLGANAALNNLTNVFLLHAAAGIKKQGAGKDEYVIVPSLNYEVENNFGAVELGQYTEGEAVPLMEVDNLAVQHCKLMIIDVEGMELDVLRGGAKFMQRFKPQLYVANHRKEKSAALIGHLRGLGYRLFWNVTPLFNPNNFYGAANNIFDNTVTVGMMCFPPGDFTKVDGREISSPDEAWHGLAQVTVNRIAVD